MRNQNREYRIVDHMQKRMQAVLFLFLSMMLLLSCIVSTGMNVQAQETNMQLTDSAGLLTEEEAAEVEEEIARLEQATGWDFMAVTTADAGGMDATTYAETWFDDYTINDDGIILAIDMDNREIVIRAFGECMFYITDNRRDKILDAGYEEVSNERYADTFLEMLEGVEDAYRNEDITNNYLQDEDTGEITRYKEKKQITLTDLLISFVAALAAAGVTAGGIIGKYRLKFGGYKYPIEKNGSVKLNRKEDHFINQFVTHRTIPKSTSSGGGGGGGGSRSTTHTGAGGRSSSGGSRKF